MSGSKVTEVDIHWSDGPGSPKDWIGLFPANVMPGTVNATSRKYVTQTGGSYVNGALRLPFPGDGYMAGLFINDSNEAVAAAPV